MNNPDNCATLCPSEHSEPEVRAAYKALMHNHHPDHNAAADATLRCVEINRAYKVRADPTARAKYDAGKNSFLEVDTSEELHATRKCVSLHEQDPVGYLGRLFERSVSGVSMPGSA